MPTHEDRDHHELSFWDTTAATTVIFRKQTVLMVSLWHKVGLKIVLPSVSLSTSPLSSAPSFMSKNTKIHLLEGNWGTSMIQRGATDGSSQGLKEKLLTGMLWNRHCHWTDSSHFSLPDCCWQRGSPEVSSLPSMPTAPPLHLCPFITLSFLFRSRW